MFLKLLLLVSIVIIWLLSVSAKRSIIQSFLKDLKQCEEDCQALALNPCLPIGCMSAMSAMLEETRKAFDAGALPFSKFLTRLPAMQRFFKDAAYIASPLLLFHVSNDRFSRACNDLITDVLPRAIMNAKASFPERGSRVHQAIERAEQAVEDAGNANESELIFTYRRCAIAKAEMDNLAAYE